MLPLGEEGIQQADWRRLELGEEGPYLPRTWRLRTLDPSSNHAPAVLQSRRDIFVGMMRLLHWLLVVDGGGFGSIVGYNGGLGIDVDEVVVVTVDLGRGALVVALVSPRAHVGWAAPAARCSMAGVGVPG
jgi:hypothetical protein